MPEFKPPTAARKLNVMVRMNEYERSNLAYGLALVNKQREIDGKPPIVTQAEFVRYALARVINDAKRRRDDYGLVKPPGRAIPPEVPA